jgi:glutathione peroxidase
VTTTLGDFTATDIHGDDVDLSSYDGQVVLVVNTASQCGMTPQYAGLQELYDRRRSDGLVVLGFPCDQFGNQEPGSEQEIAAFCESSYGVTFPMFAKLEVNGDGEHPLYTWLKSQKGGPHGADIDWNFTKFLLDRDGNVLDRFGPTTTPEEMTPEVEKALAAE